MKKQSKKGFTLVELVIVIAVIGILAAVLIPTFSGIIDRANQSAALQGARTAFTNYMLEHADDDASVDLVIMNDKYAFKVVAGQLQADPIATLPTVVEAKDATYEAATGTYVAGTTYYTDATGASEVDTDGFVAGTTDVSSYYVLKTAAVIQHVTVATVDYNFVVEFDGFNVYSAD